MKTFSSLIAISLCSLFLGVSASKAQCDLIAETCDPHLDGYISDGQSYRALLRGDQVAEFQTTLFEGTRYRLAACSDTAGSSLIFKVLDEERNVLFTNADYGGSPYWDFEVPNTMDCIVEARLDPEESSGSGCAVLLVGFKE